MMERRPRENRRPSKPGNSKNTFSREDRRPERPKKTSSGEDRRTERPERPKRAFSGEDRRTERPERPKRAFSGEDRRTERPERPKRAFSGEDRRTERPERPKKTFTQGNNRPVKKAISKKTGEDDIMRLNRYIANSGVCARREADELITRGLIYVNGKQVVDLGTKVKLSDNVVYQGKKLVPGKKVYILLNKPRGYVTTVKDPHAEFTVLDLVKDATDERIYPVGRLDKSTTGVLLLTNDGDLAGKLTHPSFGAKKVYHVFLDKEVTKHDLEAVTNGVELDEGTISADAISYADMEDKTQVGIEIHSGQNRVVRRIFEKLGYNVKKLDRVFFAGLTKKNLQRGTWRYLTDREVSMLKRGIFK